jgi:hypothetical protein
MDSPDLKLRPVTTECGLLLQAIVDLKVLVDMKSEVAEVMAAYKHAVQAFDVWIKAEVIPGGRPLDEWERERWIAHTSNDERKDQP